MYVCFVGVYIYDAAEFLNLPLQKPYMEIQLERLNGTGKKFPANGINFASAGSGVLPATNNDSVSHVFSYCYFI